MVKSTLALSILANEVKSRLMTETAISSYSKASVVSTEVTVAFVSVTDLAGNFGWADTLR